MQGGGDGAAITVKGVGLGPQYPQLGFDHIKSGVLPNMQMSRDISLMYKSEPQGKVWAECTNLGIINKWMFFKVTARMRSLGE